MPAVSVVIPTHNGGAYLAESVASVLGQSFGDLELIVVDDGSTDGSVQALVSDPRLRVVTQSNQGVSAARNRGAVEASSDLVAFLDADDRWLPDKLARQLEVLHAQPDALVCYTAYAAINPAGERLSGTIGGEGCSYLSLFEANPIPMSSAVVRRAALLAAGGFDSSYSTAADWDLWLRLAQQGRFCCVAECLTEYRVSPYNVGQMSGDPWLGHLEVSSVLGRHELRAIRTGDNDVLAAIRRARRASRAGDAAQAAGRFVESLGSGQGPDWSMARIAFTIDAVQGTRRMARLLARRIRHGLRSSPKETTA
jgi:hypothetical protein